MKLALPILAKKILAHNQQELASCRACVSICFKMASDCEKRKITDLRVVDLKAELDKRGLDKTGVKALLIERLQGVNIIFF